MDTQSEIRVLTPDERAELKRLAEGATPGPWVVVPAIGSPPNADGSWPNTDRAKWSQHCGVEQGDEHGRDASSIFYADSKHVGAILQDADYIAAVSPDTLLAYETALAKAEARASSLQKELAEQERAALGWAQEIEGLRKHNAELQAEISEGSGYVEELDHTVSKLNKLVYGGWKLAVDEKPACPLIHRRTGHKVSTLFLVAQEGVTHLEPHYMRNDGVWFSQHGSFATPDITHYHHYPADPGTPFAPAPVSPSSQDPAGAEPWRAVFATEAEYDASVESAVARIERGEVKPIEQAGKFTGCWYYAACPCNPTNECPCYKAPESEEDGAAAAPKGEETRREEGRANA